MLEAHSLITGQTPAATLTLELTFDDRQKSRHRSQTVCGQALGWFIERGHVLKDGDLLQCTTGEVAVVVAAPESVSTVYAKTSLELTRAAYHLGNRHVPLQITDAFLRYQHDHVLDDMVRGLGLNVECEKAAFQPEPGAYAGGHSAGHGHSHSHDH
ncbi:urease accessory protein UreE [Marinagarivorans cellulosilyticus]|uniref:Urease accessory protein UreE n=1 Tax=Marinagarivorans cellulosilyticus TaxID=2721545 RepID=A0AAN1WGZ0_9GAMM|nr:urease accessory protein UreE [Marinagarivorans cellulosilyticus]BCD97404.1 urease accessory protein [Marinagarivorans cellulosilyticus]